MTDTTLQGQVALVTGATRGIGRAIAHELARAGATVVGTATTDAGAAKITEDLAAAGQFRIRHPARCRRRRSGRGRAGGHRIAVRRHRDTREQCGDHPR